MNRNIALSIILSIITCGIYGIYWMIVVSDETLPYTEEQETSGITAFLLSIITCGIYGIYWQYKVGLRCEKKGASSYGVLFLVLSLLGFQIINTALTQDVINKNAN